MKKNILLAVIPILLLLLALLLLQPFSEKSPDKGLVQYWKSEGLNEKEAEFLAQKGPARLDEAATSAALLSNPGSLEAAIDIILADRSSVVSGSSAEGGSTTQLAQEILASCQETGCLDNFTESSDSTVTSSLVFWESNIEAIILTQYCQKGKVGKQLFSRLYLSQEKWKPRYILQTLSESKLSITADGKEDLRRERLDFARLCRESV